MCFLNMYLLFSELKIYVQVIMLTLVKCIALLGENKYWGRYLYYKYLEPQDQY
jgi:hypothetical protein